jgi:hypothetical protein
MRGTVITLMIVMLAAVAASQALAQAPIEDELVLQTPVSKFVVDGALRAFAAYTKEKWNVTVKTSALHEGTPVS